MVGGAPPQAYYRSRWSLRQREGGRCSNHFSANSDFVVSIDKNLINFDIFRLSLKFANNLGEEKRYKIITESRLLYNRNMIKWVGER
jgi:hypothetical protein